MTSSPLPLAAFDPTALLALLSKAAAAPGATAPGTSAPGAPAPGPSAPPASAAPTGFDAISDLLAGAPFPSAGAGAGIQPADFGALAALLAQASPILANLLGAALQAAQLSENRNPWGFGSHGFIDANRFSIPQRDVFRAAEDAIRSGRTRIGGRGTPPTPAGVNNVMGDSWNPRLAPISGGVKPMSQLDYADRLGNGDRTIRNAGCFLTSMAMASSKITGDRALDPRLANERVKQAGGFSGSGLRVDRAAGALGMKVLERSEVTSANARSMNTKLDQSLQSGRPVVAGVDYKSGDSSAVSAADHFITLTGKNRDGSYSAIDPAGGRRIDLTAGSDGFLRGQVGDKTYRVSEMTFLDAKNPDAARAAATTPAPGGTPGTPTGQRYAARGTGYYPFNNAMEGGYYDRIGKPLHTLQDYVAGRAPYVSVAMDRSAFPYGTRLRIPELEQKYGRPIDFRVVDTGGAFRGMGTSRIDICTANAAASRDATINGRLTLEVVK